MNDEQLDKLIAACVQREETVAGIKTQVANTIERERRKVRVVRMLRVLALCVVIPLAFLLPTVALLLTRQESLLLTVITLFGLLFFYVPLVGGLNKIFQQTAL